MRQPNGSSVLSSRGDSSAPEECDLLIADDQSCSRGETLRRDTGTPDMAFDCADDECCAASAVNGDDFKNKNKSNNNRLPPEQRYRASILQKLLSFFATSGKNSKIFTLKHDWIYSDASLRDSNSRIGYNFLGSNPQQQVHDKSNMDDKTSINRASSRQPPTGNWLRRCLGRRSLSCMNFILLLFSLFGSCWILFKLMHLSGGSRDNVSESGLEFLRHLDKKALFFEDKSNHWLVAKSKCHIPNIDAWHESIKGYVRTKKPMNCDKIAEENGVTNKSLTFVQDNLMYFTAEALLMDAPRKCCTVEVTRPEEGDDKVNYNKTCIPFIVPPQPLIVVGPEGHELPQPLMQPYGTDGGWLSLRKVLRIECLELNYTNVHSFIVHEMEEEEALARVAEKQLDKDQYYNVVLLGIDTISRLNAIRQLGRSLKVLRNQFETLEFLGYNKVGENTFPNLIPFLTGMRPEQLTETQCWLASNYSQESETGDDYLDDCKYLWNYYQSLGYITYFSEDWPKASTFNYLKPGFKRQPTAYYGRPFTIARDGLLLPEVGMGCSFCLGDKPIVGEDLEYLKSFIREHEDKPYFAFHWINCPQHDDLNGASQIDYLIEKFLKDIHDITQRDRTFVIVFSDHGYRWEQFVSTRVGHYEASLPLMTIAPPKHFIENHPNLYKNLKRHRSVLFTPFDMFKTLIDIRNLGLKTTTSTKKPQTQRQTRAEIDSKAATRARNKELAQANEITFLENSAARIESTTTFQQLQPITGLDYRQDFKTISLMKTPEWSTLDRSCIEAGIPDSYCVCHEFRSIKIQRADVLGAAYYLVYVHLYLRIKAHTHLCHTLDLEKIHSAEVFNFGRMKAAKKSGSSRKKRDAGHGNGHLNEVTRQAKVKLAAPHNNNTISRPRKTTPNPNMVDGHVIQEKVIDEKHYLPNREYNIRFSTKPGSALFQEVVRYYGNDPVMCRSAVEKVRSVFNSSTKSILTPWDKYRHVQEMNKICKFSVHSDSISRLNLYKTQSACVTNNIELKKVCYCNDNKQ